MSHPMSPCPHLSHLCTTVLFSCPCPLTHPKWSKSYSNSALPCPQDLREQRTVCDVKASIYRRITIHKYIHGIFTDPNYSKH
ncbi:hypothetical protein SISSUDRAFT_274795 [Sistotremastrum suecicum HHB10207 ss-3]|uniref:Uncharacterized protein n=1 Tax=Sistotremastrum suecicum HHB10207 ss-3 TaxID=1314776 RepID=A0A165ZML0_9AGAM|nr:hypothetical protein SISSUDRAFT_274795 [Sistotremastrum suecicum HHB10207 ss-3]